MIPLGYAPYSVQLCRLNGIINETSHRSCLFLVFKKNFLFPPSILTLNQMKSFSMAFYGDCNCIFANGYWSVWASLVVQTVKCLSAMLETQVRSLCWEDPLEKEMATHSSTLAWKIPWTEEPGRLQSMGSQRVGHD